jgi:hypothetical protein
VPLQLQLSESSAAPAEDSISISSSVHRSDRTAAHSYRITECRYTTGISSVNLTEMEVVIVKREARRHRMRAGRRRLRR